jgi:hypothetical protein
MFPAVLGFFSSPKNLLYMAGAIVAGVLMIKVVGFVNTAVDNAELVVEQAITIQLKDGEIATQTALTEQLQRAAVIAEIARLEAERREGELRQISDDVIRARDEDDGAVAPVLKDTMRALRSR